MYEDIQDIDMTGTGNESDTAKYIHKEIHRNYGYTLTVRAKEAKHRKQS